MKIDVVLPCLDEAAALRWVLAAHAGRLPRRSWSTTAPPTARREIAAALGAHGGRRAAARLRRRLPRRAARPRRADVVCFMDADASLDPAAPAARSPTRCWPAAAIWCSAARRPTPRRLAGARPARQRRTRPAAAPAHRPAAARPRADARRPPRRPAGPGPAPTAASATRWRWCCAPPTAGWRIAEVDVAYLPRARARSKVTGTVRGTVTGASGDMRRVMRGERHDADPASSPRSRCPAGSRPGSARPSPPSRPPGWPRAALEDTLRRRGRDRPVRRRVLALDGTPGPWLPDGFDVIPQRGRRARRSGSRPPSPTPPAGPDAHRAHRHGHPPGHPGSAPERRHRAGRARRGVRPGRRRRLLAARAAPHPTRRCCCGVPMSRPDTGAAQLRRLHRAGLAWPSCPSCATSTPPPTPARSRRKPRAPGSP